MVERRITDGRRIAELLASEVEGRRDGPFAHLTVVEADRDADPSPEGTRAYAVAFVEADGVVDAADARATDATESSDERAVERDEDGAPAADTSPDRLATVFMYPDRARVDVVAGRAATSVAESADLQVEPVDADPPRVRVVVESGAAVKRATDVLAAAARARLACD